MTVLAHKIQIYPNNVVISHFNRCFGVSRFAYNWGLDVCKKALESKEKVPSGYDLSKQLNSIKREQFPWMYDVSKWVVQKSLYNLSDAFKRFLNKMSKFPSFKKKGKCRDSFYIGIGHFEIQENRIHIPKIGWVRMSQSLRFDGKPLSVTISRKAGKYFASIQVELPDDYTYHHICKNQASVGVDIGIKDLAVLSSGEKFVNSQVIRRLERKLKRLQRSLSRKEKGSKNRDKVKRKLSLLYFKIRNIRLDNINRITSGLVSRFRLIAIEDLNVSGMLKNHKLAKSISDSSFYEFKRQLEYKSKLSGSIVETVDRFFPSSKLCSSCGKKNVELKLSDRMWKCESCGTEHDRDVNAAINILNKAAAGLAEAKNVCGENRRRNNQKINLHFSKKQKGGGLCKA